LFNAIAWVGIYSYSIYLIHLKAGPILSNWFTNNIYNGAPYALIVFLYFSFNILVGYILSLIIEQPFLRLRDKYFPRR
jgi:peptidoglycan/LPS O-acetylase OafA/YrhL